jgi:hypothetical protein
MTPRDLPEIVVEAAGSTAAHHRRVANWLTLAVLAITAAAVLLVIFAVPSDAKKKPRARIAAYTHIQTCKDTLRGLYGHDDDIHRVGVQTGAQSFGGWTSYGRYSNTSVYVWGAFNYSYGKVVLYRGRCTGGDFGADWFDNG